MVKVEIRRKRDKSLVCTFEDTDFPEGRLDRMNRLGGKPELSAAWMEVRKHGYEMFLWSVEKFRPNWGWKKGRDQRGEKNAHYGYRMSELQKKWHRKACKESKKKFRGKASYTKRLDVRRKISISLSGPGNPHSKRWRVTFPDGRVMTFTGGLKRFLESVGLTYYAVRPMLDGLVETVEGLRIERVLETDVGNTDNLELTGNLVDLENKNSLELNLSEMEDRDGK